MINQPLLDFIKQQLQVGLTKEKISSDLLKNGWTLQDIEEGFKAVVVPIPTVTPPVSPYAGASYSQNTNFIKTAEPQQQTFQPQVQQSPIQQTQTANIGEVHPFIKYGLIMGIIGIIFFIASFLLSSIKNISGNTLIYLALFEITISLISVFCIMLVAKMLKCNNRTFIKALSAVGIMGFLSGLIYLITLLKLPDFIPLILGLAGLIFTFFFLKKIYIISYLRAFSLWLLYALFTSIIALIIFFAIGFSFLFSLFNALQDQNLINNTDTTQQVFPTQDQTQQVITNSIKIITPAVGETYNPGQTITIMWTPGVPGITYINFYKSDNSYSTMAAPQSTPDISGSIQYTFPIDMPIGQYKTFAFYKDKNNIDIKAYESDGYFNITYATKKIITTNPILNSTNLQTYTNSKFGFSFSYPKNWILKTERSANLADFEIPQKDTWSEKNEIGVSIDMGSFSKLKSAFSEYKYQESIFSTNDISGNKLQFEKIDDLNGWESRSKYVYLYFPMPKNNFPNGNIEITGSCYLVAKDYNKKAPNCSNAVYDAMEIIKNSLKSVN